MIVFALGGFTCIISILRLQSLLVFLHNSDISWHNPLAAIWSSLEVNIGILCSCLPTLKAMVSRYFPRAFNSSYLRGSDHSNERGHAEGEGDRARRWRWTWGEKQPTDATSSSSLYYGGSSGTGTPMTPMGTTGTTSGMGTGGTGVSTSPAPAAVTTTAEPSRTTEAPVAGANSFTEGQARSRIEDRGFAQVRDLKKDDQGIWRGMAMKDGKSVAVALDYQGNIVGQ